MTRPSNEPCRSHTAMHERIGTPCPSCGHTDLAHPGMHNPSIDACLLCQLEIALAAWAALPRVEPGPT